MAGKEIKVSKTYKTKDGFKLNAQWLKNATASLGSNAASVLQDISPNIYGVAESAASLKRSLQRSKVSQGAINQAISNNKYVKMGKSAIDNALKDLKSGNFDNSNRGSSSADTEGATYNFGEITDDNGETTGQIQATINVNPEGLNEINASITKQTKYQMQAAKANVDAIVASSSAMLAMNQKNAEASLNMLTNINNSLQAIVKYNNENMSKFIASSMTYYEMMGKAYASKDKPASDRVNGSDIFDAKGNLNYSKLGSLLKQNAKDRYESSLPGQLIQMVDMMGDELVANPLRAISTTVMKSAIPNAVKKATKDLDKTFGNFITEMMMKTSQSLLDATGKGSTIKNLIGSLLNINVDRKNNFDTANKVTKDAAVFDGITRNSITVEIPKYLRESTSYLRQLVMLNGGDPDKSIAESQVFNKESGRFENYADFTKNLMGSINESIISVFDESDFGKTLSKIAENEKIVGDQQEAFQSLLKDFYIALEKDNRSRIDITKRGDDSDVAQIISQLSGDRNLKKILEETVYASFQHGRGGINLNSTRLAAKAKRNQVIADIEESNIGDISSLMKPGQTIDDALASVLYGQDGRSTRVQSYTPTSLMGKITNIEDLLTRGINVRIQPGEPFGPLSGSRVTQPTNINTTSSNNATVNTSGTTGQATNTQDISSEELTGNIEEALNEDRTPANGRGAIFVNKSEHLGNMMHYMLKGDMTKVYSEMGALFGDGLRGIGTSINDSVLKPLKGVIFGKDENGEPNSITGKVSQMFVNLKNDMADFVLGPKNENGERTDRKTSIKGFLEEGLKGWSESLFGPDKSLEDVKKEITEKIQKNSDAGLKGAVAGAGLGIVSGGILGTLVGGPLTGALLGSASAIFMKSKSFQKLMFGDQHEQLEGKDGKKYDVRKGGLISPETQKFFKEHKRDMMGAAGIGAIGGAITGGGFLGTLVGGPVAGALIGTAVGIAKNSDKFKNFIFGEEKQDENGNKKRIGGLLGSFNKAFADVNKPGEEDKARAKKLAGMNLVGAGTGLLASMFTPLGPIGGAALGLASSMYASKNKFHDLLFGKEEDEGENKGLLGKLGANIQKTVVAPLAGIAADALDAAKDAVIDKVLDPILDIVEPFAGLTRRLYDKVEEKVSGAFDKVGNFFSNIAKNAFGVIKGLVGSIFNRKKKDENGPSTGFGIFGSISNAMRKSNEKASSKKWNSEAFRNSDNYADAYALMEEEWNSLSPEERKKYKNIDDYEQKFAKTYFFNGGNSRADRLEGRESRRQSRVKRRQERRDTINREALITELTKGKYSTDTEEGRAKALEAYKNTRGYKKSKGMNGISDADVQRLLRSSGNGDAKPTSASLKEQIDIQQDQLDTAKSQLNVLDKIYLAIADRVDSRKQRGERNRTTRKQERQKERYESELAKYKSQQDLSDTAASVRDSLKDKVNASEDYSNSFFIAKDLKKPIQKAADDPNNDNHDLALTILNPETPRRERQAAYDEFKRLLGYKKSQKKAKKEEHKNALQTARKAGHEITRLTMEENDARLRELSEIAGGRGYATGTGNAKEGAAVVGERGPEIVRFSGGEKVLSNDSTIKVRIAEVDPNAAKVMNDNGTMDVNIIGQTGPIVTYGTAAKLDHNTDNKSQIEKALSKKDSLVSYSQIKSDNNDLDEENGKKEESSIWDKIKDSLGGLLKTGGIFATIYGIVKLLGNEKVQEWISNLFGVLGQTAEQKEMLDKTNGYEGGADATTNMKNQTERLTSLFSDPSQFLLGADGKADSMTGAFLHGGRALLNAGINGKSAKGAVGTLLSSAGNVIRHPLKSLSNAVFHPVKSFNAVTSTVANAGKSIGNTIAHPIQAAQKGLQQFGAQASFFKNAGTAFKEGGFDGVKNLVDDTLQTANGGARRGLAGTLFNISDKTGAKATQLAEKYGVDLGKKGAEKVAKETAETAVEKGAKETVEAASEKAAKEAIEAAGKKGAATIAKETVEETGEKGIKAFIKKIPSYLADVGKFLAGALKKVLKKGGSEAVEKASKEIAEKASKAVTKGLTGKLKDWIMKKITKLLALISGTAAVSATGVGFLGVLAKDAAFITIGALNNMGKGGAARLFRCEQKDVDWKMQAISTAFGGLVEIGIPGAVVDVLNEIVCAVTGIDLLSELATLIYKGISSKEKGDKLTESRSAHMEKYEEYSEKILEEEYQAYLEENGLTPEELTKEQFSELVSTGQVKTNKKGFDEWNDQQNKTVLAKAGDAIKSGASAAWNGIKGAGNAIKSGASAAWNGIKGAGNAIAGAATNAWNGAKKIGGTIVDNAKESFNQKVELAKAGINVAKNAGGAVLNFGKDLFSKGKDAAADLASATVEKAKNSIETFNNIQEKGLEALKTGLGIGKNVAKKAVDFGKNLLSSAKDYISGKSDSLLITSNGDDDETNAMNSIVSSVAEKVLKIPRAIGQLSNKLLGFFKDDESDNGTNSLFGKITSVASSLFGGNKNTETTKSGAGGRIPFYSQKDPRWGNMPYTSGGAGESMGEIGCGPTAFAMAASGSGHPMDPIQAAGAMQQVGARDNTGTNWSGIGRAASMYGIESHMQQNPSAGFIDSELDAGNPVILSGKSGGFGNTPYTPQGHYVVATGKDSNGNYIVNDPNKMGGSSRYNKNDILSETGAAWGFGGRGYAKAIDGSGSSSSASKNTTPNAQNSSNASAREKWLQIVRAVKKAIASAKVGYSQSNWIKITVGGKTLSVRTDCSGFVTACLKFFGVIPENTNIVSKNYANGSNATLVKAGFSSKKFTSWDDLKEGDIIAKDGHVEIFARNENGNHYVYNCGSNSSCNNPNPTITGHKAGYSTVWVPGLPGSGVVGTTEYSADASGSTATSSDDSSATVSSTSSSSSGTDFFSKITTFFTELGSRAATGLTTGNFNTDWSGVFDNNSSSSSDSSYSTDASVSGTSTSSTSSTPVTAASGVTTGSSSEKGLWNLFKQKGLNDYGTAGVMGNLFAESGLRTNNVQNSCEKRVGSDTEYTAKVDNGSYTNFANDSAGYGLAQWTYSSRKQGLLNLARQMDRSIADPDVQTTYLLNELNSKSYKGLYDNLKNSTSVRQASDLFMTQFERPKDQSESAKAGRASKSQAYYDKYASGGKGGYGGFGEGGAVSTGSRNPLYNNRVVSSGNKSDSDRVSEVIHYLSQILSVLGESSDKLNALNALNEIAKNSGRTINANSYYSTTNNNTMTQGTTSNTSSKTDPAKYGIAEKIAKGGL